MCPQPSVALAGLPHESGEQFYVSNIRGEGGLLGKSLSGESPIEESTVRLPDVHERPSISICLLDIKARDHVLSVQFPLRESGRLRAVTVRASVYLGGVYAD